MLRRSTPDEVLSPPNRRRERTLWDDGNLHTPSLGCIECDDRHLCGGLRAAAPLFDCLGSFCCDEPDICTKVCPNNADFADRVREIGGFELGAVERAQLLSVRALPFVIPILFHGNMRAKYIGPKAAAISLYQMFERGDGTPRFSTREALCDAFRINPDTPIILTGTDRDAPLERWWGLGPRRRAIARAIRKLGIVLTTTPNYSLFIDVPRWDNLYSMKRIALVHQEFLDEGLPAALHVNARTETDFLRWTEYVQARPEVTHLAYEFGTGTGWAGRREQHAAWLSELAGEVGRPLNLVVRGGVGIMPTLVSSFSSVSILDTSTFWKTIMRQRAVLADNGRMRWLPAPTAIGAPLDTLLRENLEAVESWLAPTAILPVGPGEVGAA